jgi:hypothetical protein
MALSADSTATTGVEPESDFSVGRQTGEIINNVGGSQNIFLPDKTLVLPQIRNADLTPGERAATVLGFLLFWSGLALLAYFVYWGAHGASTAAESHSLSSDWTTYVHGGWYLPFLLVFAGMVIPRLALRLFGRSAGPG